MLTINGSVLLGYSDTNKIKCQLLQLITHNTCCVDMNSLK